MGENGNLNFREIYRIFELSMQIFTFAYLKGFFVISGHNDKVGAQELVRRYERDSVMGEELIMTCYIIGSTLGI